MANAIELMIPVRKLKTTPGRWKLPAHVTLSSESSSDRLGLEKTATVLARAGVTAECVFSNASAGIRVLRDRKISDPEGYRLTITPKGAAITASTDAGAFYGLATLRELIRAHGRSLPCLTIDDAPAFERRGVYHDCARGKVPTLATLKALVERLAEWKINELQLYIENAFAFRKHPQIGRGYSPITPEEILALQEHCKAHHIRLVPSLASFGHMEKILCLPKYAPLNELPNGSTLCPIDPGSLRLIEELYSEFVPLFDATDFNVCCDETWDLGRGRSKPLADRIGTGQVYLDFLKKIRRLCQKHGKRMNAWSDIVLEHPELLPQAPRDMVMLNWEYEANGERIARTREIARAGLPFMVCPGTSSWNTVGSRWPNAMENIRNFAAEGAKHGAEGLLNTDWGDFGHKQFLAVSLMGFAFGAAESWNPGHSDGKRFPRAFALQAFGDRQGALGDAIEALGNAYLRHGVWRSNADPLELAQTDSIRPGKYVLGHTRLLDRFTPEGLACVLASLPASTAWSIPQPSAFEALALAEYALACRQIALYCMRGSFCWDLGMGRSVPRAATKRFADQFDGFIGDFRTLWLARNKPSRLADNLRFFKGISAEARKLANA